jgi:pentatricopeptide repeat protein
VRIWVGVNAALEVLKSMEKTKHSSSHAYTSVLRRCKSSKDLSRVFTRFEARHTPDTPAWNTLILHYAKCGDWDHVHQTRKRMRELKIALQPKICTGLLQSLKQSGVSLLSFQSFWTSLERDGRWMGDFDGGRGREKRDDTHLVANCVRLLSLLLTHTHTQHTHTHTHTPLSLHVGFKFTFPQYDVLLQMYANAHDFDGALLMFERVKQLTLKKEKSEGLVSIYTTMLELARMAFSYLSVVPLPHTHFSPTPLHYATN